MWSNRTVATLRDMASNARRQLLRANKMAQSEKHKTPSKTNKCPRQQLSLGLCFVYCGSLRGFAWFLQMGNFSGMFFLVLKSGWHVCLSFAYWKPYGLFKTCRIQQIPPLRATASVHSLKKTRATGRTRLSQIRNQCLDESWVGSFEFGLV